MAKQTAQQRREWQERVTAMPTRADIERCQECWPRDWQDKTAFYNGQVAALLDHVEHLQARLEAAWRQNERLEAENDWLRGYKGAPAVERLCDGTCDTCPVECFTTSEALESTVDKYNRCQFCGDFVVDASRHGYGRCYDPAGGAGLDANKQ